MKLKDIILFGVILVSGFSGCAAEGQAVGETIICHKGWVLHCGERYIQ